MKGLYGEKIRNFLSPWEVHLFSFSPGEKSKTRKVKEELEDALFREKLGRDTTIIGLGGGVVTDIAGFVAATFCRGVPLILIPTTLMGMVDASIGGKVGVNTPHGKNLVGAYYFPKKIFIDSDFLSTLSEHEMRNGKAEVLKYGLIQDKELLYIEDVEEMIRRSVGIKESVVTLDPDEKGLRRVLNFGHTIGHAIEAVTDYEMSHGDAITIGMRIESYLSMRMGYLKEEELQEIDKILPIVNFSFAFSTLYEKMQQDKKARSKKPRFVLLEKIGQVASFGGDYCIEVDDALIEEGLLCLQ